MIYLAVYPVQQKAPYRSNPRSLIDVGSTDIFTYRLCIHISFVYLVPQQPLHLVRRVTGVGMDVATCSSLFIQLGGGDGCGCGCRDLQQPLHPVRRVTNVGMDVATSGTFIT